jgi:hypothetical protein
MGFGEYNFVTYQLIVTQIYVNENRKLPSIWKTTQFKWTIELSRIYKFARNILRSNERWIKYKEKSFDSLRCDIPDGSTLKQHICIFNEWISRPMICVK